jgi:NAD(P)-dependent dehydrogenase (short-subunit alcohol dehydrogenase family)
MARGRWSVEHVGDQSGRTALVTGGNSGIGLETARVLAGHGAHVVIGCRDSDRAEQAAASIRSVHPAASVEVLALDLADLGAVAHAAETFRERHERLDILCNNAGVMAVPYRATADGFELQFGVNHVGHFALTGHLLGALLAASAPRVVTVSSTAHRIGSIDFDNLDAGRGYRKWPAYAQSKLANLLFTLELQRRAHAAGSPLIAAAAHPGYAATNLQARGPQMSGSVLGELAAKAGNALLGQSAAAGALPTLYAATMADVVGGDYFGPRGLAEARGRPTRVGMSAAARDEPTAARLWEVSEQLTGVGYEELQPAT